MTQFRTWAAMAVLLALASTGLAFAQEEGEEEDKRAWSNKTEFGFTSASGNAENTNLSLTNNFKWNWSRSEFYFDLVAIRNEATARTLSNPGTGEVVVTDNTALTAEIYAVEPGYRMDITERLYWYVNARWYRNKPAGIQDRYLLGGGIGYKLVNAEKHILLGELGVAYTDEDQISGFNQTFTSARIFLDYDFKINDSTTFSSDLETLWDVSDSDNWQANWITAITASMTKTVALSVSYAVIYDNQPAVTVVPPDAGAPGGTLPLPYLADTTDTFLTASVVLNF